MSTREKYAWVTLVGVALTAAALIFSAGGAWDKSKDAHAMAVVNQEGIAENRVAIKTYAASADAKQDAIMREFNQGREWRQRIEDKLDEL